MAAALRENFWISAGDNCWAALLMSEKLLECGTTQVPLFMTGLEMHWHHFLYMHTVIKVGLDHVIVWACTKERGHFMI